VFYKNTVIDQKNPLKKSVSSFSQVSLCLKNKGNPGRNFDLKRDFFE